MLADSTQLDLPIFEKGCILEERNQKPSKIFFKRQYHFLFESTPYKSWHGIDIEIRDKSPNRATRQTA